MKRMILSLLALMSIAGSYAQSQIFDVNGIYYRLMPDTINGTGNDMMAAVTTLGDTNYYQGEISIPSTISYNGNNYDVKEIADHAFKGCKQLTSIVIPASVLKIPAGAFYGCNSLESIKVASDNTVYDSRDNCNAVMETATNTLIAGCKNTVTPITATSIGECAFYGCSGLVSINLPYSIISIGKYAFLDCTGLYSAAIPESITKIEEGTFEGCTALTSAKIPANINSIGECAFYGCPNLEIEFPSGATDIGENAFYCINTLYWNQNSSPASVLSRTQPEAIVFGNNVTSIDYYRAFSNCQRLKSITIPASVKTINLRAFEGLHGLETINWNANVSLSRSGLINTSRTTLKTFILGDSVTIFDGFILNYCINLETIAVDPGNPVYDSRNNCNAIIESVDGNDWYESYEDQWETDSYYYSNYYNKTKDRLVVGCKNTVIPNTVTSIGEGAFANCTGLTSIYIPANIKKIYSNPFMGCSEIGTITVDPGNTAYDSRGNCNAIIETQTNTLVTGCKNTVISSDVTGIGDRAFSGCSGLTSITISSNITKIGNYAFFNCTGLKTISIPETITTINVGTFMGCSGLTDVELPSGITVIKDFAFHSCSDLRSIQIPSNVTYIGHVAFSGCSSLSSIVIPSGVTQINNGVFSGCSSLTSITIPAEVDTILSAAFAHCTSLTSLLLPSGIKFIAPHLVEGCFSLESINIPSQVDSIGKDAFVGCYALQTAGPKGGGYNYEFDWDTIPANAFRGLSNLRSVYIPQNVKAIYECDNPDARYDSNLYSSYYYDVPCEDYGYISAVFYGCDNLESVAVSFKGTKIMRLWRDPDAPEQAPIYKESPMDFNLYRVNNIKSITILDDSITDLKSILTEGIIEAVISKHVCAIDSGVFSFPSFSTNIERGYFDEDNILRTSFCSMASNLERITVEGGNSNYSSNDGVLLNKDGNKLLLCPSGRKNGYYIPGTVVEVTNASFRNCKGLKFIQIPVSVEYIGDMAFDGCDSLEWVTFEGSPEIGKNAFSRCHNISSIAVHSATPGLMNLCNEPQTIIVGDAGNILNQDGITVNPSYNNELGRVVSEITAPSNDWTFSIITSDVPSGRYKLSIGILPSSDGQPNIFHPAVWGVIDNNNSEFIYEPKQKIGARWLTTNYTNDVTGYDSIFVTDSLVIPEGFKGLMITIKNTAVNNINANQYSNTMTLDRIFFEPTGNNFPEKSYSGPFTESVFNNAILYVPDCAVETYRAADGWKLFKSIAIDTAVDPIRRDSKSDNNIVGDAAIYDIIGRRVKADSIEQLAPGLYIINGKKWLKR